MKEHYGHNTIKEYINNIVLVKLRENIKSMEHDNYAISKDSMYVLVDKLDLSEVDDSISILINNLIANDHNGTGNGHDIALVVNIINKKLESVIKDNSIATDNHIRTHRNGNGIPFAIQDFMYDKMTDEEIVRLYSVISTLTLMTDEHKRQYIDVINANGIILDYGKKFMELNNKLVKLIQNCVAIDMYNINDLGVGSSKLVVSSDNKARISILQKEVSSIGEDITSYEQILTADTIGVNDLNKMYIEAAKADGYYKGRSIDMIAAVHNYTDIWLKIFNEPAIYEISEYTIDIMYNALSTYRKIVS